MIKKQEIEMLLQTIKRVGITELISFLAKTDYYVAPASSKYHLCIEGGLAQHSYNVYKIFSEKNKQYNLGINEETTIICGLLHDVTKVFLYEKQPDGTYQYNKEQVKKGHGKLSVERIKKFIVLTEEETAIIKFHSATFGAFSNLLKEEGEYTTKELHEAIIKFPTVQIFASSDMEASIMETKQHFDSIDKTPKIVKHYEVLEAIQKLDTGKGVSFEELEMYLKIYDVETYLKPMQQKGILFYPRNGFVKAL